LVRMPGSVVSKNMAPTPRCSPAKPLSAGAHELRFELEGLDRRVLLYVPSGYNAGLGVPVIVVPQAYGWTAEFNIQHLDLLQYASKWNMVVAALDAPDHALNVAFDARANPLRQNDVAYTSKVLSEVDRIICLDARRIFCAGFSRGARFCSRLASERSDIFAAVATMSGLRFPRPNNATRPVPILAFHGTGDKINPFEGGGPKYWMTSVPDAVSAWVNFNGCKEGSKQSVAPNQVMHMYSACWDHAHVVLMEVKGGGHEWPDSSYKLSAYSPEAPRANELIMQFFNAHPLPLTGTPADSPGSRDSLSANYMQQSQAAKQTTGATQTATDAGSSLNTVIRQWEHLQLAPTWSPRTFNHGSLLAGGMVMFVVGTMVYKVWQRSRQRTSKAALEKYIEV